MSQRHLNQECDYSSVIGFSVQVAVFCFLPQHANTKRGLFLILFPCFDLWTVDARDHFKCGLF